MANKRVLILTYYWPPSGGAGVQRWLKFAKYMPRHGWKPVVFVPEGANYPALDPKLESEVPPSTEVWKGPIVEPASWLDALKLVRQQNRFGSSSSSEGSKKPGGLASWIRGNVFIPDARMFWIRPSVRRLTKRLKERPVDAIVSTGPPHSTHLIALGLKKAFPHIPWVADFRDPWSDMDYLEDFSLTARSRTRHKALEQQVVSVADRVVVTAPSAATSLLGRPLEPNDSRGVWIPNGFDVDDGFDLAPASTEGPLVLGFFGSLYGSRNAPGLWRAIRDHNADRSKRPVQLVLYGALDPSIRRDLEGALTPGSWEFRGNVAHEQVPHFMSQCHALVILQNNNDTGRRTIPGKAFEYLAAGRPLVAGGALNSDLEQLLQSWGFDMCGMDDSAGFARQIEHALAGRASSISPERFQRDVLAFNYSQLLHNLVD